MLGKICYVTLCGVLGFYFESIKLQGLLQGNSHNKFETLQITDYTLHKRQIQHLSSFKASEGYAVDLKTPYFS